MMLFNFHHMPALSVCVERAFMPSMVAKLPSDEAAGLLIQFQPRTCDCADGTSAEVSWFTPAIPTHIFQLRAFDSHHVYLPGEPFEPVATCSHFDGLF